MKVQLFYHQKGKGATICKQHIAKQVLNYSKLTQQTLSIRRDTWVGTLSKDHQFRTLTRSNRYILTKRLRLSVYVLERKQIAVRILKLVVNRLTDACLSDWKTKNCQYAMYLLTVNNQLKKLDQHLLHGSTSQLLVTIS